MNSKKFQTHYYLYNNERYENMKDCCKAIGTGIPGKSFKHFIRVGLVEKILINQDVPENTNTSEYDKATTETRL